MIPTADPQNISLPPFSSKDMQLWAIWTLLCQTPKPVLFPLGHIPFFRVADTIFGEVKQKCLFQIRCFEVSKVTVSFERALWHLLQSQTLRLVSGSPLGLESKGLPQTLASGACRPDVTFWVEGKSECGWLLRHSLPHKPHVKWLWLSLKTRQWKITSASSDAFCSAFCFILYIAHLNYYVLGRGFQDGGHM